MNRINQAFQHKALIAYLTVGFPSPSTILDVVPSLASWGCDIVELGIPFSDPLADGATIQEASFRALKQGVTPRMCLDLARDLRKKVDIPLLFMTYYNPILSFGVEAFCAASAESGIDGMIVPDLPPEEAEELEGCCRRNGLALVYLLAPTSTPERIALVTKRATGFIYLVSLTGVTGARTTLPSDLEAFVLKVREKTSVPLCVGFGISTPEQVHRIAEVADGVIVGSRILQLVGEKPPSALREFIRSLRRAL